MIFKAMVYDTQNGEPREITPEQILLKNGQPYALFSDDSQQRYEEFHIWDDTEACKWNNYKPTEY